jgi:molybdopterin synthase sulfur carrier subunit
MIRVVLPYHLQTLARVNRQVAIELEEPVTLNLVLDTLEDHYPALRGTIRDQSSKERRAFIRFFVCGEDWSHKPVDAILPAAIVNGEEPLRIVGALAGG